MSLSIVASQSPKIFWFDWVLVLWAVVWLLVLWSFGASPWSVMILGFGVVGWWMLGRWWSQQRPRIFAIHQLDKRWVWWWGVWFVVLALNVVTSQIPVQSAGRFFWWVISFLWFWWWSSIADAKLKQWLVTQILSWGLISLTILSWFIAWFHPWFVVQSSLELHPNFLLPFFGHHHLAALIILMWPSMWLVPQLKRWRIVWISVFGVTLLLAFSRSAWLALLLQVAGFFWFSRKFIRAQLKIWAISAGIFCLVLTSGFLLKDLLQSKRPQELPVPIRALCYQWWSPNNLCALTPEPRFEYWHQALVVWQHFPLVGSGLDTFGQVAKRWQTNAIFQTQYPHQMLLQVLAEQGLVGFGIWLSFFIIVFQLTKQHVKQTGRWEWSLSIIGALVIGNLDFDWQLAGFFLPFLLLVSGMQLPTADFTKKNKNISKFLFLVLILVFGYTSLSALTWFAVKNNWTDKWIKIWPYSAEWQVLMAQKITDASMWQKIVQQNYAQNPEVWFSTMTTITDTQLKWTWLERLWLLDPVRYWDTNPLAVATKNHNNYQIQLVLTRLENWLSQHPESGVKKYNPAFGAELFVVADEQLVRGNWELASQALRLAQIFDPWILHNQLPTLMKTEVMVEKIPAVLQIFANLNQDGYGDHLVEYRFWYQKMVLTETKFLWQQRQRAVGTMTFNDRDISAQFKLVPAWVESVKQLVTQVLVLLPDPQSRGEALTQLLTALILNTADDTVSTRTYQVSSLYRQAQQIEPWVLNNKFWWFEKMELIKPETAEFLHFAADWQMSESQNTGEKPQSWILFYNRVLLLSLRSGNFGAAFQSLSAIEHYAAQLKH